MSSNHRVFPRPDRPLSTRRDSQPEDKSAELFRPCLQLGIPWKLLSEATGISGGFREPALTHCPELDLLLALDLSVIAVFSHYHFRLSSFLEHRVNKSFLDFSYITVGALFFVVVVSFSVFLLSFPLDSVT